MKLTLHNFTLRNLLAFPFISLIRLYQLISPLKQLVFGPYARCRFHPTCSEYALECFRSLSLLEALCKTLSRIARCNPMHPGGVDPVPTPIKSISPKTEP